MLGSVLGKQDDDNWVQSGHCSSHVESRLFAWHRPEADQAEWPTYAFTPLPFETLNLRAKMRHTQIVVPFRGTLQQAQPTDPAPNTRKNAV